MFTTQDFSFLEQLLITPSPVGFESEGQKIWLDFASKYSDETRSDAYGSAYVMLLKNPDAPTVMLEAHCDEIGMMVQYIDDKGFVYITRLGGSDPTIARAKKVNIHARNGKVTGVIGNTAIHLQDTKNGAKSPAWKDLFVDIGVNSREEALQLIQIGDPITFTDEFEYINDDLICGRALDNRMGGFIIAQAFKMLAERKEDLHVNVVALNSVQEEIGGFGARMMTYRIKPDMALVTDVTHATDTPGINHKEHGLVTLGQGPSITHGAASHPLVVRKIEEVAQKHDITIQHEAASIRTGTDTDSIYWQRNGIPCGLISLPLRYMHSPVEMASLTDVANLTKLMAKTILSLNGKESFQILGS